MMPLNLTRSVQRELHKIVEKKRKKKIFKLIKYSSMALIILTDYIFINV